MRNFRRLLIPTMVLAAQVASPVHSPATALVGASASADSTVNTQISLNTKTTAALDLKTTEPDFDTDVLAPLRAAQAKAAADAAAAAAAAQARAKLLATKARAVVQAVTVATGDVWERLRLCEAGGDYTRNSGNGYYGAYQYDLSTWANYDGYARPDLAPPAVQDAKARSTQAARGWAPWPACARKLGLM